MSRKYQTSIYNGKHLCTSMNSLRLSFKILHEKDSQCDINSEIVFQTMNCDSITESFLVSDTLKGVQVYHFGKNDLELGVGGKGQGGACNTALVRPQSKIGAKTKIRTKGNRA